LCFLYQDHADFGALFIALYEWHEGLRKLFFRDSSKGSSPPLLELTLLVTLPIHFFYLDRGKKSSQTLPDVWVGWTTLQVAKLLFYWVHHEIAIRSTAKLSKAYKVNNRWQDAVQRLLLRP
jgi:hypothetical protein